MTMHNLNLFAYHDVAEDGKEGENCRKRALSVHDQKGDMVHFETIGKVAYSSAASVGVRDDDNFMASIDQFLHLR